MRPILSICSVLILALLSCEGDNPVRPVPVKDYSFYAWCGCDNDWYYAVHTVADSIDTIPLVPYYAWYGLQVSADGGELYVAMRESVKVIQISDYTEIASISQKAYEFLEVSSDGNYIAIGGESLAVYTTGDYSMVYHKSGEIYAAAFAGNSSVFYYADRTVSPNVVRRVDLLTGNETDYEWPSGGITEMRVRQDESTWYLYSQSISTTGRFEVYDVASDSIVFREWLSPSYGTLQLSPDERWVAYSYPGTPFDGYNGPSQFTLFDATENRIKMIVSTAAIEDGLNPVYMPIGEIEFAPDGRTLLAAEAGGAGSFLMFDLRELEIIRYTKMAGMIGSFSCQQRP